MKSRTVITLIIMAVSTMLVLAPGAQGKDEWEKEFQVEPGQKIELKMKQGGSLEVQGWDKDLVRIVCRERLNDIDDYDLSVKEKRSGLYFEADLSGAKSESNSFTVELMVPRKFDIESHSGGGGIMISDVHGTFEGRTAGGSIELKNISGDVDLTSGGGQILIVDSDLDGRVKTGGGGGLVRNVTGNVKATSGGGIVNYENVRDRDGDLRAPGGLSAKGITSGTIVRSTAGGGIKLKKAPEGAKLETGGGSIRVRNASRFVEAKTGGGDIEIEIEDGYVVASTGAGEIEVSVDGSLGDSDKGLRLVTGHGEITVYLPANASVDFDIDLSYTRNSSRDFELESDFDMDYEFTKEWDVDHGTPRKHIYGTGSINGGKHKVIIHAVNGNVIIKKR